MNEPKYDPQVPEEVRVLLIAADTAADHGCWDRSHELLAKARRLTAELAKKEQHANAESE